jgi:uncharacterized protein (DUF1800 family)
MIRTSSLALLVLLGAAAASGAGTLGVRVDNAVVGPAGVAFGTAAAGQAVAKTFTVTNAGAAPVALPDFITVPRGFTVMEDFATNQLPPGQSASFVAALNSAAAGPKSGNIAFTAGTETVTIPVSGVVFGPASLRVVRASDPGFQTTGQWVNQAASSGTGANTATWTFTDVVPGTYQVAVTWSAAAKLATNAPYTVFNDKVPFTAVPVNQRRVPADLHDAGAGWKVLGSAYRITNGTLSVQLTDQANGTVQADGVRVQRVGFPGRILEVRDPGVTLTGAWSLPPQSTQATATARSGAQAAWTVTGLVPGQYRVSASWQPTAKSSDKAAYTILDGDRALATVQLNQRQAPADLQDAGATWQDLGGLGNLYYVRGNRLVVRLSAGGPEGTLAAGAIRLERIYNPAAPPPPGGGPDGTSYADAVRLLEQATWGPTDALIAHVMDVGIAGFLIEQLYYTPVSSYPTLPLVPADQKVGCPTGSPPTCARDKYSAYPNQIRFYTNALYGPDQLIQRVSWAWHKIMVTSAVDGPIRSASHMAPYLQIFDQNGTGLYHDLLTDITLNPAMGYYLNMQGSTKAAPNENYAREVLQLFSIGLNRLNPNGTLRLDANGMPIPTYDQTTIDNFAKIFTGWILAAPVRTGVPNYIHPMIPHKDSHGSETPYHDETAKVLLRNVMVGANRATEADLASAINNIVNDPNVGPFIGKQLIEQLVTSNPTPAYVARITAVFNDNGGGIRGDMGTVVLAILTDPEARGDAHYEDTYGKLREPVLYINNVLRAFNALSYDQTTQSDGYLNPQSVLMAQDVFRPASVFSYFSPFATIPDTPVVAPEFQILDTSTSLKRYNFINTMTVPNGAVGADGIKPSTNGPAGTKIDFTPLESMANDPGALLDYLNGLMLHNTMSDENRAAILPAINAVPASNLLRRAKVAVYLVATSSQYQVQR